MDSTELNRIKRLLKNSDSVSKIYLDNCGIIRDSSNYLIVDSEGEYIFSLNSLSNLSVDMIEIINSLSENACYTSDIDDWVVDTSDEYPKWESPITEEVACIKPQNNFSIWNVVYPLEPELDIFYETFNSFTIALINLVYYLKQTNAYKVDYKRKLESIAIQEFQELPGVSEEFAEDIVVVYEIYSYQGLVDRFDLVSSSIPKDKVQEFEDIITERANSTAEIDKSKELSSITTHVVLDNI